jgi:hypothetical protein
VSREARLTAPEAGALPIPAVSFRFSEAAFLAQLSASGGENNEEAKNRQNDEKTRSIFRFLCVFAPLRRCIKTWGKLSLFSSKK